MPDSSCPPTVRGARMLSLVGGEDSQPALDLFGAIDMLACPGVQFGGSWHEAVQEMVAQGVGVGEAEQFCGVTVGFVDGDGQCEQPGGGKHLCGCSVGAALGMVRDRPPLLGVEYLGGHEGLRLVGGDGLYLDAGRVKEAGSGCQRVVGGGAAGQHQGGWPGTG